MTLRLLIDVSVGYRVEEWLREAGFDIVAVRDLDPFMLDHDILARALWRERIVVTMDKDFGDLVFRSGLSHAGVLLLRLETETSSEKINVLSNILDSYGEHLPGSFCVYQGGRLRVHRS